MRIVYMLDTTVARKRGSGGQSRQRLEFFCEFVVLASILTTVSNLFIKFQSISIMYCKERLFDNISITLALR